MDSTETPDTPTPEGPEKAEAYVMPALLREHLIKYLGTLPMNQVEPFVNALRLLSKVGGDSKPKPVGGPDK